MNLQSEQLNTEFILPPPIETLEESLATMAPSLKEPISHSARELFLEGYSHSRSGDWRKAAEAYRKLVNLAPSADSYYLLGMVYYKTGQLTRSASMLEKAVKLSPRDGHNYFSLGLVYLVQDKLPKAINTLRKVTLLNPDIGEVYFYLGYIHSQLKHQQLAIESYKKAIQLRKGFTPSYLYLANTYENLGKEKAANQEHFFNEAIAVYKQLLENDSKHIGALRALGKLYHSLGQLEEAEKVLEKAIKSASNNEDTLKILRMVKEDQLAQKLCDLGLLKKINKRITDFTPYQNRKSIRIKGKPLSETVIEDRR